MATIEIKWRLLKGGKFLQVCCACGRVISTTSRRWWATPETNPLSRATIRHEECDPVIRYDKWGRPFSLKYGQEVISTHEVA